MPIATTQSSLDEIVFIATNDLSARTKGRALPAANFDEHTSVGWVPANLGIGPLGHIVKGLPFGSSGDLRLKPDPSSRIRIDGVPNRPPIDVVFGDLVETDGAIWHSCLRTFLRSTVETLREEFGIEIKSTFEHEFVDLTSTQPHHPFSFEALRNLEPMGSQLLTTLSRAGLEPENWLPEYATNQYEITLAPTTPVTSADRAILVRDIVRETFASHDRHATFAPIALPGSGGSGVHVHFGMYDLDGNTQIFDSSRPGRLSTIGAKFAAGIIKYAPTMTAMFAPLTTSYERLKPHNWSTARSFLGVQNREALLRVCPTNEIDGRDPSQQLHLEFRGSDAGANPWMLLGMLLCAGMEGLRQDLAPAEVISGEVDFDSSREDLMQLPSNLNSALEMMLNDMTVTSWFSPELVQTFAAIKQDELNALSDLSLAEQIKAYTDVL